jgi:hypothetical protein
MIYNRITNEIFNNVADCARYEDKSEKVILELLKQGYYLHFKKDKLYKYVANGTISLDEVQRNKLNYRDNIKLNFRLE